MTKRINAAFEVLSHKDKREQLLNYNNIVSSEFEKNNKANKDKQIKAPTVSHA